MVQFEILDNRTQKNMKVAYARVSRNTQDLEFQTQELLKDGCKKCTVNQPDRVYFILTPSEAHRILTDPLLIKFHQSH